MKRATGWILLAALLFPWLAAAETPQQLYEKGMAALTGTGLSRSDDNAYRYMRAAAEGGYVPAQTTLGYFYEYGVATGAQPGQALDWYKKAAQGGDTLGQFLAGRMYVVGTAVATDCREAERWLRPAAEAGSPHAAYLMGVCEDDLDYRRAPEWYLQAAQQGLPQAQARYGKILMEGRGVSVDKYNAYVWMLLSYEAGNSAVGNDLSMLEGDLGSTATERAKEEAHAMQAQVSRRVRAQGCTWAGEFDALPAAPPPEVQRYCR